MIAKIIRWSGTNPVLVLLVTALLVVATFFALPKLALDALPDLSDTQVLVAAEYPGRAADIVENQITYPLVTRLLSTPRIKYVRGVSMNGASQITAVFQDGTDIAYARARIVEQLAQTSNQLPAGIIPQIGPDATGLGWVFQYALVSTNGQHSLAELRALQDFHLKFELQSVPGVAEIASLGGFVKQYQVELDPQKLRAYDISPLQVSRAIRAANQESGPGVIELDGTEYALRARGYLKSAQDILDTPLQTNSPGQTLYVRDVANVQMAPAPRAGVGEYNGKGEAVSGIVVMRMGENALNVINGVKQRLHEIKNSLPPDVEVVPVYDRSSLIESALSTLRFTLFEEILLVAIIVSVFLWHARASVVAILPLPIAVLFSFLPMVGSKLTVNIMSLGGIVLAIGAMVDSGIILVENAHKKLEGQTQWSLSAADRRAKIIDAMVEMGRPLFFSLLVITVSFLPIFALEGREGRLFSPLAFTKTVSMAWAAFMAITVVPALSTLFLKGTFVREENHGITRFLHRIYEPAFHWVMSRKKLTVAIAALVVVASAPIAFFLPSEFMPPLNEGSILYMPTAVPGMSADAAAEILQKQNAIIASVPEVERVYGKAGRASTPTDPAPMNMFETVITLKPQSDWRKGMTFEKIVSDLDAKLNIPGMANIWWMPIQTRLEMLSTGIRTAVGVKIFGNDVATIEKSALEIEAALKTMPGVRSVFAERATAGTFLDIAVDRRRASKLGLSVADVQNLLDTVMGGNIATTLVEGRELYTARVRYAPDFRSSIGDIEDIFVPLPAGGQVRLKEIALVSVQTGPAMVNSENGKLVGFVFVDVASHVGISEFVASAKKIVDSKVNLPAGVSLRWSGQYESLARARQTLIWVVPITLLIIGILIFINTKSLVETGIVFLAVPFSLVGAFWLMWILNYKLSVAAWVGILALAGLDAETGVVMLLYLTQAWKNHLSKGGTFSRDALMLAIHDGAVKRVRPKIMTVAAALIGLLPVMWSTGTGSEVMKRIAAPMIGGIVTSGILELLLYPVIFAIWQESLIDQKNRQNTLS